MDNINFLNDVVEEVTIDVKGKSCKVLPILTMNDLRIICDKEKNNVAADYREILAEIISDHTKGLFPPKEILNLDDSVFQQYIESYIKTDEKMQQNYRLLSDISDEYKRFIKAINKTQAESFSKANLELMFQQMKDCLEKIHLDLSEALFSPSQELKEVISSINSSILSSTSDILGDFLRQITLSLHETLGKISFPTISEEKKQQLIDSYIKWGEFGWTVPPEAEGYEFNIPPDNATDAYNRLRYCINDESIEKIFDELRDMKHIRKSDLNEAITCYKAKQYKSCCLVIFSMIDSRLIRSQRHINGKSQRPSGKKAAANLFKRIEADIEDYMIVTLMDQANISSALQTVFGKGNDFQKQPNVINRNFLDHGMLYRRITKKDCIMLFILLYNFTCHLNLCTVNGS